MNRRGFLKLLGAAPLLPLAANLPKSVPMVSAKSVEISPSQIRWNGTAVYHFTGNEAVSDVINIYVPDTGLGWVR